MKDFKKLVKEQTAVMVDIEPKYLMGTKAYHQLGDISSNEYDLFTTSGETDEYWVGMWVTGFGFFNVLFPKETSRELTDEEVEKYNKLYYRINSQPSYKLNIKK
jgi:hypothetical protein